MARQFADDFLSLFQFGIQQQEQRKRMEQQLALQNRELGLLDAFRTKQLVQEGQQFGISSALRSSELAQQSRELGLLDAFRTKQLAQQGEIAKTREAGLINRFYLGELGQQERSEMLEKGRMERANIAEAGREKRFQEEQKAIESRFQRRENNITKRSNANSKTKLDISKPYGELKKAFGAATRLDPEDENYVQLANSILNVIDENLGIIDRKTGLGEFASDIAKVMYIGGISYEDAIKRFQDKGGLEGYEDLNKDDLKALTEFYAGKKYIEDQRQNRLLK